MAFVPNTTGQLLRKQSKRTIHGKEIYDPPVPLPCSIVRLSDMFEDSSVRADSTASRGAAEQSTLAAKILIPIGVSIAKGDVIRVMGRLVDVSSIHPRNDVLGRPHHLEIDGNIKGDM